MQSYNMNFLKVLCFSVRIESISKPLWDQALVLIFGITSLV